MHTCPQSLHPVHATCTRDPPSHQLTVTRFMVHVTVAVDRDDDCSAANFCVFLTPISENLKKRVSESVSVHSHIFRAHALVLRSSIGPQEHSPKFALPGGHSVHKKWGEKRWDVSKSAVFLSPTFDFRPATPGAAATHAGAQKTSLVNLRGTRSTCRKGCAIKSRPMSEHAWKRARETVSTDAFRHATGQHDSGHHMARWDELGSGRWEGRACTWWAGRVLSPCRNHVS